MSTKHSPDSTDQSATGPWSIWSAKFPVGAMLVITACVALATAFGLWYLIARSRAVADYFRDLTVDDIVSLEVAPDEMSLYDNWHMIESQHYASFVEAIGSASPYIPNHDRQVKGGFFRLVTGGRDAQVFSWWTLTRGGRRICGIMAIDMVLRPNSIGMTPKGTISVEGRNAKILERILFVHGANRGQSTR